MDGPPASYFDTSSWDQRDVLSGGSRMIPVSTPSGEFRVWTKRVGNNADLKVLLLHGGPGASSELYESFDTWFPRAGIEYYYYDQLGSFRSSQPDDSSLWTLGRFVDEVEQVRQALGLDRSNFVLLGQSWGGLLALEYAVRHQQRLMEHHYVLHVCRMPQSDWPDSVTRSIGHINPAIYVPMQGPSELGLSGTLEDWDRSGDLQDIEVPTLVSGATHDTMDPEHMRWMSEQLPKGRYLHCPNGSHLSQFDDPEHYFPGLIDFLRLL